MGGINFLVLVLIWRYEKKWLAAMSTVESDEKEYDPPKDARLCHKHLIPSDYELTHKNTRTAIPTTTVA